MLLKSPKSLLRALINWRYGTKEERYFRAAQDHLLSQSAHFRASVEELQIFDDRILEHHVASGAKSTNLLKVKMRLVTMGEFIERCVGRIADSERVIDVGAASGVFLEMLGKKGIGVDAWEPAVKGMRANGLEAMASEGESLPFEDSSFAYGFAFETLEHAQSPLLMLHELARLCTKGVFVSIPFRPTSRIAERHPGEPIHAQHIFELSSEDLGRLAAHCGLQVVSQEEIHLHDPGSGAERFLRRRSGYDKPSVVAFFLKREPNHTTPDPRKGTRVGARINRSMVPGGSR